MARKTKEYRELKIGSFCNYGSKESPMLRLQGLWMQDFGFKIGDPVLVKCEDGKLIISVDHLKSDITHLIKMVDSHEYQIILEQRYLCFKTWEQISVDLGYSIQHTFRLHDQALREAAKFYKDES